MTIQEAFATNKPIARKNKASHRGSNKDGYVDPNYLLTVIHLTVEDILATDWEVEEEKFEITLNELHKMIEDLYNAKRNPILRDQAIAVLRNGGYK